MAFSISCEYSNLKATGCTYTGYITGTWNYATTVTGTLCIENSSGSAISGTSVSINKTYDAQSYSTSYVLGSSTTTKLSEGTKYRVRLTYSWTNTNGGSGSGTKYSDYFTTPSTQKTFYAKVRWAPGSATDVGGIPSTNPQTFTGKSTASSVEVSCDTPEVYCEASYNDSWSVGSGGVYYSTSRTVGVTSTAQTSSGAPTVVATAQWTTSSFTKATTSSSITVTEVSKTQTSVKFKISGMSSLSGSSRYFRIYYSTTKSTATGKGAWAATDIKGGGGTGYGGSSYTFEITGLSPSTTYYISIHYRTRAGTTCYHAPCSGSSSSRSYDALAITTSDPPSYTVTFSANGGTIVSGGGTQTIREGQTISSFPTVSRSGSSSTVDGLYTVTFDYDDGRATTSQRTKREQTINYSEGGWYTAASGGTHITTSTKIYTNYNLYVHWESTTTYGSNYLESLPTPTRSGYTFKGWYTGRSGQGTKITAGYSGTKFSSNTTIYAYWEQDWSYIFMIRYLDSDDTVLGTQSTSETLSPSATINISRADPTKTGWSFEYWHRGTVHYSKGDPILISTSDYDGVDTKGSVRTYWKNIKAYYTINTYVMTIHYKDYNNATIRTDTTVSENYGVSFTPGNYISNVSSSEYEFHSILDDSGTEWSRTKSYTVSANKTWTIYYDKHLTLTIHHRADPHEHAGSTVAQDTYAYPLQGEMIDPTHTKYRVIITGREWSGSNPSESFPMTTDTEIIEYYRKRSYQVSYNANGGTGTLEPQTKYEGEDLILYSGGFTRSHYTLMKWCTTADETGDFYSLGGTYSKDAHMTLYAFWRIIDENVSFNVTYASTSALSIDVTLQYTVNYDRTVELSCNGDVTKTTIGRIPAGSKTVNISFANLTQAEAYRVVATVKDNFGTTLTVTGYDDFIAYTNCHYDWTWAYGTTRGTRKEKGKKFRLTAAEWNGFMSQLATKYLHRKKSSISYSSAVDGNRVTATIFNQAADPMRTMGFSRIPHVSTGQAIKAEDLNNLLEDLDTNDN